MSRGRRSALFDVLVAALIVALALSPILGTRGPGLTSLLGIGMAVALLARRRHSLAVMAVVSGLALAQVLIFPPADDPLPYDLAVLIAMYSVVKYSRPLWPAFLAAATVALGVAIEVVRHIDTTVAGTQPVQAWALPAAFLGAIGAAGWLTGYTVRTRHQYMLSLEERAATAERERDNLAKLAVVEERAAIARDLQDVVAHSMAVMIVQADGASYALDGDPELARLAMKQVGSTGRDALEDMRRLVGVLRGAGPDQLGADSAAELGDRRRLGLDQLDVLVDRARSAGLTVTFTEGDHRCEVPAAVELTVYRIVQEALTNVLRHAGPAAQVGLVVRLSPKAVEVDVVDDGGGGLMPGSLASTAGGGHGLVGMRERIAVHGGTFEAGPKLGGGWRVVVTVPWP